MFGGAHDFSSLPLSVSRRKHHKIRIIMKKNVIACVALLACIAVSSLFLAGCSSQASDGSQSKVLKIGVCAGPYQDLVKEAIEPSLTDQGYKVDYVEFSDYIQPNNALAQGEIDANVFQHSTYLKSFSSEHGLDLVSLTEIPTAAMGVFSQKVSSLDALPTSAVIAIPNDDTNLSRSLRVLQQAGVIVLDPNIDPAKATVGDIVKNPQALTLKQVNAEVLPSVLDSVDAAVINGNYAIGAGLDLADAAYVEQLAAGYYNVIAVRSEDEMSDFAQAIKEIVTSDAYRRVIEDARYPFASFGRPSSYQSLS